MASSEELVGYSPAEEPRRLAEVSSSMILVLVTVAVLVAIGTTAPFSTSLALVDLGKLVAVLLVISTVVWLLASVLRRRVSWLASLVMGLLCAGVCVLVIADAGLRMSFVASRPQFEAAAKDVLHGRTPVTPTRLGWIRVLEIRNDAGVAQFTTARDRAGNAMGVAMYPSTASSDNPDTYIPLVDWWWIWHREVAG